MRASLAAQYPAAAFRSRFLAGHADFPLVLVTWHDAWFDFEESDPQDCRTDYLVRTVGFLVNEGPRFLSIAQEILPDGDGFRAVTHIPRSIVEEVTTLTAGSDPSLPATG